MKSFLSDRPRVSLPDSPSEQPSTAIPAPAPALAPTSGLAVVARPLSACTKASGGRSPSVECIREGDRVTRLVVTCGCGEEVVIECVYAARA
jgi:hypothetical protein